MSGTNQPSTCGCCCHGGCQGCPCPFRLALPTEPGQVWTEPRPRRPHRPQKSRVQSTGARSVRGSVPVFLSGPGAVTFWRSGVAMPAVRCHFSSSLVTSLLRGVTSLLGLGFLISEMSGWDQVLCEWLQRQPRLAGGSFSQVWRGGL